MHRFHNTALHLSSDTHLTLVYGIQQHRIFHSTANKRRKMATPLSNSFVAPRAFATPLTNRPLGTMAREQVQQYDAVVVGAGPAGLTVLGNLLDKKLKRILWVDPEFEGGRVNSRYREVPSNTKVTTFLDFARALETFREVIKRTPSPNAISAMEALDQSKGCELSYAADMCLMLTEGLSKSPYVQRVGGHVSRGQLKSVGRAALALGTAAKPSTDFYFGFGMVN